LRVLAAGGGFQVLRAHRVNGEVSYDWLGDTLVVAQLDWTSRWQVHSDLYRWFPDGEWRRVTRAARLVTPRAGGGCLSVIALLPGGNRPVLPVPAGPGGATWGEVVPSPDGRRVAGTRNANGHWALLRWPADSPQVATLLRATAGVISDPTWTPAGDLLFVTDPTGFPQVYRWRDAAGAEPLTAEPLGARAPAALPDGTLLYATLTAAGWELRRGPGVPTGAPVPADRPAPFDSAPPVTTRETGCAAVAQRREPALGGGVQGHALRDHPRHLARRRVLGLRGPRPRGGVGDARGAVPRLRAARRVGAGRVQLVGPVSAARRSERCPLVERSAHAPRGVPPRAGYRRGRAPRSPATARRRGPPPGPPCR